MKKIYLQFVNVNDLQPAPFNPPVRTSERATKDLVRSMKEHGFYNHCPITITENNYIADGHRRWTAAKTLGIDYIPALVTNLPLEDAWASAQESNRPLNGKELIAAYALGLRVSPRNSVGKTVQYYANKYGEELLQYLYQNNKSIVPIKQAEQLSRYVGWNGNRISEIVCWIVENKMSRMVQFLFETNFPRDILRQKIENNESIRFEGQ